MNRTDTSGVSFRIHIDLQEIAYGETIESDVAVCSQVQRSDSQRTPCFMVQGEITTAAHMVSHDGDA